MSKKPEITVVCIKVHDKYGPEYVNILYNMVSRNLSVPHKFVCITDDTTGINPEIETVEAMYSDGWWTKLSLFAPNAYNFRGKVLYFDLDVVIVSNINKLANYDASFAICRDWVCSTYNSSVMLLEIGTETQVWDKFDADRETSKASVKDGDQGFIGAHSSPSVFPERFISSYKVHCKGVADPISPVVIFHGRPNPPEVQDSWVMRNWK